MGSIRSLTAVLLLLLGLCAGQRMVTVQNGHLYRAKGYHITIWCNVSSYEGPLEQTFEWSVYRPSAPTSEMQLVSTSNSNFPYAAYAQRVKAGEIYVERIRGDSVLLHITRLQAEDAGEYECYTPNTDERYYGTYSAKTKLSVIPDTLSATMKPQDLTQDEGDSLELLCEASTGTAQHTHLSVAWYLVQGDGQDQEIISLSRDFVLIAGSSYNQRASAGDIRLDKIGDKTYKLSIVKILPSDQGKMYCEAVEWIQDPDETWKDIARKQTNKTSLTVRTLDDNIFVKITVAKSSILEGEVLQINCSVQAQNIQNRWFQLVWLHRDRVVASIDQRGALAFQEDSEDRYTSGNLLVKKESNEKYILRINQAELNDKGIYRCEVSEMERSSTGSLVVKKKSSSSGTDIKVSPRESDLKLVLRINEEQIMEGEALIFHCKASVAENPLSVKWWYILNNKSPPVLIANMDQDGILKIGTSYLERSARGDLRLEKVDSSTFTLTIYNTSATDDSGLYRCELREWFKGRNWEHTQEISASVESLGTNLKAVLFSRTASVTLHEDFELYCRVSVNHSANRVPISIIWQFHPSSALAGYQKVVKITADSTIEWGSALLHFQKKTKITKSSSLSQLLIHSATWQDAGLYKCEVEAWRNSLQASNSGVAAAAVVSSNPVEIKVTQPENKLHIEHTNHSIIITENDDATLKCLLRSQIHPTSRFSLSWFKESNQSSTETLLKIKENGIIEYGDVKMERRLRPNCPSPGDFHLTIQDVEVGDSGLFYCEVEEWTVNCSTAQVQQALVRSGYSELTVLPPVSLSTSSTEICSSASFFHFLLFYPLVMFLVLMAAITFLCFKIKFIHQKRENLKTKQESGGEIGLVPPAHLQDSGKRNNSTGNEETSSLKVGGVD